jgi:hypothetical protein
VHAGRWRGGVARGNGLTPGGLTTALGAGLQRSTSHTRAVVASLLLIDEVYEFCRRIEEESIWLPDSIDPTKLGRSIAVTRT